MRFRPRLHVKMLCLSLCGVCARLVLLLAYFDHSRRCPLVFVRRLAFGVAAWVAVGLCLGAASRLPLVVYC